MPPKQKEKQKEKPVDNSPASQTQEKPLLLPLDNQASQSEEQSQDELVGQRLPVPSENKKNTSTIKVVRLLGDDNGNGPDIGKGKVVATLAYEYLGQDPKLAAIRNAAQMKTCMNPTDRFCYTDGTTIEDTFLLDEYFENSNNGVTVTERSQSTVYFLVATASVEETKTRAATTASLLDGNRKFIIVLSEWQASGSESGNSLISRGTLNSSSLGTGNLAMLTLSSLREKLSKVSPMSSFTRVHKFCTLTGTTVSEETTTFRDYLSMEEIEMKDFVELPKIQVAYKTPNPKNAPTWDASNMSKMPGAIDGMVGKMGLTDPAQFFAGAKKAKEFQETQRISEITNDMLQYQSPPDMTLAKSASMLTETEWIDVLSNCGALHGWVIDRENRKIVRAPKAAFRLRHKPHPENSSAPNGNSGTGLQTGANDDTIKKLKNSTIENRISSNIPAKSPIKDSESVSETSKGKVSSQEVSATSGSQTLTSRSVVDLDGEGLPYDDKALEEEDEALKEEDEDEVGSQRLEKTDAPIPTNEADINLKPKGVHELNAENVANANLGESNEQKPDNQDKALSGSISDSCAFLKGDVVMPSFLVNDDSRVEITVSSHEFEMSMATNDFSSESTEGSISGGFGGFAASVSAGIASSKSASTATTSNSFKKTMVGRYMFPRADVMLQPEDLEPTPALKSALEKIAQEKNIKDLRRLYADFGQIFCKKITIGGRLLSTKIMESTQDQSEQEEKQQFKMSIGAQVSTPYGGAGVKHEQEKGKTESSATTVKNTSEMNVFEAVGGNTILASDPLNWAPTVGDPNNWRTINRYEMSMMIDMISAMQGWHNVKNWFIQSTAKLNAYVQLDDARETYVRLKVSAPTAQLSLGYQVKGKLVRSMPNYYLGHNDNTIIKPMQLVVRDVANDLWGDLISSSHEPLFTPQSFRAPAIFGYSEITNTLFNDKVGFASTVWKLTAPFSEALQDGSRVVITNIRKREMTAEDGKKNIVQESAIMVAFRNQQGVFLPAMSSNDEVQYWRILKKNYTKAGEHIKQGDEVRLCWAFEDQSTGYRDFSDDIFGRRCFGAPDKKTKALYMKLPWPRFESISAPEREPSIASPNALLLSDIDSTKEEWVDIQTVPALKTNASGNSSYILQDISFRLDPVANNGQGDVSDYMFEGVKQTDMNSSSVNAVAQLNSSLLYF